MGILWAHTGTVGYIGLIIYPLHVYSIVTLRALDHHVISDEEIIENLQVTSSFKPLTANFRLQLHQSSLKVSGQ